MRVTLDRRVALEKSVVVIFRGPVDLEPHVVGVAIALEVLIGDEEPVHDVAPRAPFAADDNQHAAAGGPRNPQRDLEILRGIARRVVLERQLDRFLGREGGHRQANGQEITQEAAT
jgi:hypothetical protein